MNNEIHIHIHLHTDTPLTANNELERAIAEGIRQALEAKKPVEKPDYDSIPYVTILPYLQPPYTTTTASTTTTDVNKYAVWYASN